jgi:transposase
MSTADERIAEVQVENAALRADNDALRAQVVRLLGRVGELEVRLAKDSHNSSKPPSSDPLGRKRPRSQRRRSGKQPGGQLGHRGETLLLVAIPDELVEHRPTVCRACQAPLDETAPVVGYARRLRCPRCEQVSLGAFPAEASSRAQDGPQVRALAVYLVEQQLVPSARVRELVADLLGVRVSLGTLTRSRGTGSRDLAAGRGAAQGGPRARPGAP